MFPLDFSTRERRILWTISALLIALLTLPYGWAWLTTPGDGVYSGFLYNPDDQNVHLAWARQAYDGHFFIRDLFTTEWLQNGEPALFNNVLTLLIGLIARITTLPLVIVYHLVRVLGAMCAVWFFAALCAHLTSDKRVRILAVALAAFGSGIGWLQNLVPSRTFVDNATAPLTMPEAWTFHSAFVFPLFIVPIALLAFTYLQTLRARDSGQWKYAIFAGLAALLLANIHTYDVVPLNIVMILWALASTRFVRSLAGSANAEVKRMQWLAPLIVVAFTIPQVAYQFYVLRNSEEFRVKALSAKPTPPPLDIAISYAPYLILSIFALMLLWRSRSYNASSKTQETPTTSTRQSAAVMALWIIVTLILIYTPTSLISFARKMIEGVHLPLCFMASLGFIALLDRLRVTRVMQRVLAGTLVLFLSVSSLSFVGWCLNNAVDNNSTGKRANAFMPPLYVLQETHNAITFLNSLNEPRTRAVLCFPRVGNFVPRESGWPVYVGHFDETLHASRKFNEARRFYSGRMNSDEAREWLKTNGIGFVVVGPLERVLGNGAADLHLPATWTVAWNEGETTIYRAP